MNGAHQTHPHTIEARTHGRVVVRQTQGHGPRPTIVGFHGYAEDADIHVRALEPIPGASAWRLVGSTRGVTSKSLQVWRIRI